MRPFVRVTDSRERPCLFRLPGMARCCFSDKVTLCCLDGLNSLLETCCVTVATNIQTSHQRDRTELTGHG